MRADAYFEYELVRGNRYFSALDDLMHCTKLVSAHYNLKADRAGADQVEQLCGEPMKRMRLQALGGDLEYPGVYQEFYDKANVAARGQSWS